jgi:hypothetical protein
MTLVRYSSSYPNENAITLCIIIVADLSSVTDNAARGGLSDLCQIVNSSMLPFEKQV